MKDVLTHLRKDARISLTELSRRTSIPVSTLYDRLQRGFEKTVEKRTILLDYAKLGYQAPALVLMNARELTPLLEFLNRQECVNTLFRTSTYDVIAECVFQDVKEAGRFQRDLRQTCPGVTLEITYITSTPKREAFLS